MKMLVADDDLVSRRLLHSYLQKWGYEVTLAENGAEAWRLFEAGEFSLVITDWIMPELDGLALIRRIRSSPGNRYVYVMLVTSKAEKEDVVAGMDAGADDFLSKPFDRDELRVRLRAAQRIIDLEQHLRRSEATLLENEQLAHLGQRAAGMAHDLDHPISSVISNLAVLRRDVLSALHILEQYSAQQRPASPPNCADVIRLEEDLARLFDQSLENLQQVGESVRTLGTLVRPGE